MRKIVCFILGIVGTASSVASTVGNQVITDLRLGSFDASSSVWGVTQINDVSQIGIYQVPFFNGEQNLVTPVASNLPPAVNLATQYQALIATAESSVDIATLDSQSGLTLDAIRDGLAQLDAKNKPIEVRFIFGAIPDAINLTTDNHPLSVQKTINYITSKLAKNSKLSIYVGTYRAGNRFRSWNHAKILVVDSQNIITGGVNFIDSGYSSEVNPVNDLSLYYPNMNLGLPANKFLDNEWAYLCKYRASKFDRMTYQLTGSIDFVVWKNGTTFDDQACPKNLGNRYSYVSNHQLESNPSMDYAISTGRLAAVADWKQDTSDIAQVSLIQHANSSVKISQQSIYSSGLASYDKVAGYKVFSEEILKALCGAMARGVKVELMTSGKSGQPGNYPSNTWPQSPVYPSYSTADQLRDYLIKYGQCSAVDVNNPSKLQIKVNGNKQNLSATVANYQYFPNHSKVVIVDSKDPVTGLVDGKLVYVGSHNTYDQSHAEYGVIVDSKDFVDRFEQQFWDYNWNSAR